MRKPGPGPSTSTSRKSPAGRSATLRIRPGAGATETPGNAASTYAVSAEKPSSRSRAKTARASADATTRVANRYGGTPDEAQRKRRCLRHRPRQKPHPLERLDRKRQVVVDLELVREPKERSVCGQERLTPEPARGCAITQIVNRYGRIEVPEKQARRRCVARPDRQRREKSRRAREHGPILH